MIKASIESHDCINFGRLCEEKYFKDALENRDKSKPLISLSTG